MATSKLQILIDVLVPSASKTALRDVEKGISEISKTKDSLVAVKGALAKTAGALGIVAGAGLVAKRAFDFAAEGAQLDLLAEQFANVADNAGMLPDVLLGQMRAATHGMVSDAELMRSGLDIISLGLADTQEGVVDLATIVSTLGLDMQQVILTFSNNSIQRLDSLGLSVEGVMERVRELNDEGFDGDAFDQAVIEGLQERMTVLGNTWETNAGQIKQMKAAVTNFWDTLKRKAGDSEILARAMQIVRDAAETAALLVTEDERINAAIEEQEQRIISTSASYQDYIDAKLSLLVVTGDLTQDEADLIREWQAGTIVMDDMRQHAASMASALGILSEAQLAAKAEFADKQAILAARDAYAELQASVSDTAGAYQQATITLREWTTAQLGQQAVKDIQDAFKQGMIGPDEYRSALMEVGTSMLGLNENQVAASAAIGALSQSFAAGQMSVQDYVDSVQRLDNLLRNLPDNTTTTITVVYNEQGGVSGVTTTSAQYGRATGAGKKGGIPEFAAGGDFIVPPGYYSSPMLIGVHSGERVIVDPSGGRNTGRVVYNETYNITIADSGAAALTMAMIDERRRARVLEGV